MSDKTQLLRDALKKSRMAEILKHFKPEHAEIHEHEMVGEGHSPEEAMDDLHPMADGGLVDEPEHDVPEHKHVTDEVKEFESLPDLNSDEERPEDEDMPADGARVPLGNSADLDNVPAIASLRRRKDSRKRI